MPIQEVSITLQFETDEQVNISRLNEVVSRHLEKIVSESFLPILRETYTVKIRRLEDDRF